MPGSANFIGEFYILNGLFQAKIVFAFVAISGVAMSAYYAHAEPVTVGSTGQRSFATDSRGTIYFLNTGAVIPAGMAGANVLQ